MTILQTELKTYHAQTVNDTVSNGGRMGTTEIVSGAAQNVFPHVFRSDRVAGLNRFRKLFYSNQNDADETAFNAQPLFHKPPGGDHYLWWWLGTQRDTQAAITGAERKYGSAALKTTAAAGTSTLVVTLKHADQAAMFADGDPLMISSLATPSSSTGNEELNTISGTPSLSTLDLTITLGTALASEYAAGATVSSGAAGVDIKCSVDNWVETFAGDGAFDEGTYPVTCDNIGTAEQTWTLTFSDATNFTVVGDTVGSVGTGSVAADFAPVNAARSNKPYFTLSSAGWSGTPQAGDTIVMQTHPAALPVWEKLIVPAGADPLGNGGFYSYLDIETA